MHGLNSFSFSYLFQLDESRQLQSHKEPAKEEEEEASPFDTNIEQEKKSSEISPN